MSRAWLEEPKQDEMADVFDFELHETNAGSLDDDNDDDIILDDVRNLIALKTKKKNTILALAPPFRQFN